MTVDIPQILKLIEDSSPSFIVKAKKKQKILKMFITRDGLDEYLTKIESLENEQQIKLRKKYANSIKDVIHNLLRKVDKIWDAKGGSRVISGSTAIVSRLKDKLHTDFKFGMSLHSFFRNVHFQKYVVDPSGFLLFEWGDGEIYPKMKSIQHVKNYKINGRRIEWVLFEPEQRLMSDGSVDPKKYYRFIDDSFDYTFVQDGKNISIIEKETVEIPEIWGRVPAILNSEILSYDFDYAESPIDLISEIAESYIRGDSIKEIYKFLHGYPLFWYIDQPERISRIDNPNDTDEFTQRRTFEDDPRKGLKQKKDVSDGMAIKPPRPDTPLPAQWAGYISPDLNTWREMRAESDWLWEAMHLTMWGVGYEEGKNDTATGKLLNVQPVNDRLGLFSTAYEDLEKEITWFYSRFYFANTIDNIEITWGRRYLMEPPDVILERYEKLREKGSPIALLNHNLSQYYQSEFATDSQMLAVMEKAIKSEPLVHHTLSDCLGFALPELILNRKKYFSDWFARQNQDWLYVNNIDSWIKSLDLYISTVTINQIL